MKDFLSWNPLKNAIDSKAERPIFHEREIWWCSLGQNIGYEQNGKGEKFTRPVLVYKKFGSNSFLAIPLSSSLTEKNPYYHRFTFQETDQCAILQQVRTLDAKRLISRIGRLPENEFEKLKKKFAEIFTA